MVDLLAEFVVVGHVLQASLHLLRARAKLQDLVLQVARGGDELTLHAVHLQASACEPLTELVDLGGEAMLDAVFGVPLLAIARVVLNPSGGQRGLAIRTIVGRRQGDAALHGAAPPRRRRGAHRADLFRETLHLPLQQAQLEQWGSAVEADLQGLEASAQDQDHVPQPGDVLANVTRHQIGLDVRRALLSPLFVGARCGLALQCLQALVEVGEVGAWGTGGPGVVNDRREPGVLPLQLGSATP
mmetsp:Transcript_98646/g.284653  ORF Transcript_98646/g.284653 Transcript_98646/m.284653 type:complete len:243 (+) Transcript_98646:566-1294(+)